MSRVTNVILTASVVDTQIDGLNQSLREIGILGEFVDVTSYARGTKHMECSVFLAAFNHVETDTLLAAIDGAHWKEREYVQAFVREQEDEAFTLRYHGRPTSE